MIANITQRNTVTDATLTDWTRISSYLVGSNGRWATILYKIATSTDVGATNFTFTLPSNTTAVSGGITAFRGVQVLVQLCREQLQQLLTMQWFFS